MPSETKFLGSQKSSKDFSGGYKILPTKEFSKDFKKLDPQLQRKSKQKIEEVAQDPTRYKFLHYDLKRSCRVRIEKIRILFSYDEIKKELYLEKVVLGHRYKKK